MPLENTPGFINVSLNAKIQIISDIHNGLVRASYLDNEYDLYNIVSDILTPGDAEYFVSGKKIMIRCSKRKDDTNSIELTYYTRSYSPPPAQIYRLSKSSSF